MAFERQSSTLPPAQPSYILRGHNCQIHSVRLVRQNSRLLTGDAEGWVVYWRLETKRALAVWRAHNGVVLATEAWGRNKIITHGRDNNLRIWQLRTSDEATLSTVLPAEDATSQRPKPWLLYTLPVNTLNFCAFSMSYEHTSPNIDRAVSGYAKQSAQPNESIFIATPSTDDEKINVYQFPEEKLKYVVPRVPNIDTGMVMAVKLKNHQNLKSILVLAGYEGGITSVHQLPSGPSSSVRQAQIIYLSQPHSQPILSLDVSPDAQTYFTSSADAIIAAHRIPKLPSTALHSNDHDPPKGFLNTGLGVGWGLDAGHETVSPAAEHTTISPTTSSDPPMSAIHDLVEITNSPSPTADASLSFAKRSIATPQSTSAGLSSLLSTAPHQPRLNHKPSAPPLVTLQPPYKSTHTKHAGQQSLRVRSDGRILVTGGWDSRIRIYSTKMLKEIAVLKWHKEGVYAVDFAEVLVAGDLLNEGKEDSRTEVAKRESGLGRLQRQREEHLQLKHWVVAGAKDGKVLPNGCGLIIQLAMQFHAYVQDVGSRGANDADMSIATEKRNVV